jgi:tetratricopeptide (TPR) repeat protein
MKRLRYCLLGFSLLVASLTFNSCSIFGAVGDTLSQWYDDSVSYFNSYYNARKAFDEAEEGLIAAELASRGKTQENQRTAAIPTTVRDKLTSVIDRCSSILSFYPHSSLVDDALMLIGKSYFYLQDYLKAERKFSELFAQYPNSSLVLEGQLWYAKTLAKERKQEEAKKAAAQVASLALEESEPDIASAAYELLGSIAESENDSRAAIDWYSKALENSQTDLRTYTINTKLGDLFFALQDYEKANAAYLRTYDQATDTYLNYYSRIQAARGYKALKRYDTALYLTSEMFNNVRFSEYHPIIRLEYARILLTSGRTDDALDEFRLIDTTNTNTETAANAEFSLAQFYESQEGDYSKARAYYSKASTVAGASIAVQAKRRENGLGRVLSLKRTLAVNDSLLALPPEAFQTPAKLPEAKDSAAVDTLGARVDSSAVRAVPTHPVAGPVNPDSMKTVQARVAYDLGEAFHTELEIRDSAFVWFRRSLEWGVDSTRAPRATFILAELAKTSKTMTENEITRLYQKIVESYPSSVYADEARKILGIPLPPRIVEQKEDFEYSVAESLLWAGHYHLAIEHFKAIVDLDESSSLAAKSQYAIGWIYEQRLSKPDSALISYKTLVDRYKSSPYASSVRNRISEPPKTEKQDTPVPKQEQDKQATKEKKIEESDVAPKVLSRPKESKADTSKTKPVEK